MKEFCKWLGGLFEYMPKYLKWIHIYVDEGKFTHYQVVITDTKPKLAKLMWCVHACDYRSYTFNIPKDKVPKDFDWRKAIVSRSAWEKKEKAKLVQKTKKHVSQGR